MTVPSFACLCVPCGSFFPVVLCVRSLSRLLLITFSHRDASAVNTYLLSAGRNPRQSLSPVSFLLTPRKKMLDDIVILANLTRH